MPFSPKAIATTSPPAAEAADNLYTSETTRVFRLRGATGAHRVVCKEYLGSGAQERLRNERTLLARLFGVDGVAQLADWTGRAGVLALRDRGGTSLAQVLTAGPCDIATLLAFAERLARTLAEVHRAGILHRDINPANIVISEGAEPILIDFDLAADTDQRTGTVRQEDVVGTLAYLAPEQTGRTGHALDQRTDLYALGATLYEMATGRPPFESQDALRLVHDHMVREPVAPSELDARVPAGLSKIILRLLAKAPDMRYQSAEGLRHDLKRLRTELDQGREGGFDLGERDFPARLQPPRQLVGRDAQVAMLREALADAVRAPGRTVLIEGPAGVGKSALVHELRSIVAERGGWFVQGKFDQLQQGESTAGGVTQAMRAIGRLLLAMPRDALAAMRQRLLAQMGSAALLMSRVSPEFALLLGDPAGSEVDPRQAEAQLQQATVDLLAEVVSRDRPLVLVLEDLQWASALSLRTFERLHGEARLRGVLLVGVYRASEVEDDHALPKTLERLDRTSRPPAFIALDNLPTADMGELIARMLRLAAGPANELARAVGALAGGNPFDTVEMLNALRREGVLVLADEGWRWDEAQIRHFVGRGNVVDLLAARIARLPAASRDLLECLSCLGNAAECNLLATAAGLDDVALREHLQVPVADGLLLLETGPGQDAVRFRHDRVQQAVHGAMDDARRGDHQLAMARRLAREPAFGGEAAQQYLAVLHRLADPRERRAAAQLFHEQAVRLAGTAAYAPAERFLAAAAGQLAAIGEPAASPLREAIETARHAALYSLGRLDEADACYEALQAREADALDLVEPACVQMRSFDMRGMMESAVAIGLRMLARLGLAMPAGLGDAEIARELDGLAAWVREDSRIDPSRRMPVTDRRVLALAKLLTRTVRSSLVAYDTRAIAWLLLQSRRLWAEHGPCPELVANLGRLASILVSLRQDYRGGYELARHVLAVGEAMGCEPQVSEARFIFATYACHWLEPVENMLHQSMRAFEGVKAGGDVSYSCYVHILVITGVLETAETIDASVAEVDAGIAVCQRTGNLHAVLMHTCERQMLRALLGQTVDPASFDDAQFGEAAFLARVSQAPYVAHTYSACRAMHALLMGDAGTLATHAAIAMAHARNLAGYYMTVYAHLFLGMARAWQARSDASVPNREALIAGLESHRAWFAERAASQPGNYLHLLRLLEAEQAWTLGDMWKATTAFDEAVALAEPSARPWHRALITERAALFQLARGLAHGGRRLLAEARDHFRAWGATAKVARMEREHDFLRPRAPGAPARADSVLSRSSPSLKGSNSVSAAALDLMGVLRASQALSSETNLERLTAQVTEVLAGLTGATKVLVLSSRDDQWWLLAPEPGEAATPVAEAARRGLLPMSVFSYAELVAEPLLVDDALGDDRFARDPYFSGMDRCSVLAAPIAGQGTLRAMLYLENRLGREAFNAQRLDAVMLIAGQLAVSLANAQLYEGLEQRVQARTRELQQMQTQLVDTARRAGKAEIAANVLHNVGNVLNSVNVSAGMVRRTISESRAQGLARAVELMKAHEHDLGRFMESDPRGKALLEYLGRAVGELQEEQKTALDDLDRVVRSVDHISYVVATQQSHAGPSSVVETVRPQELLEEALRVSDEALARHGVRVDRAYGDVPPIELDRQRLLQIMVNLIGNAAQAMESMPEGTRLITLQTSLVNAGGSEELRIVVKDAGEGIPAENLTRIFAHGFTTRRDGHGFGLHSSVLAATEMGGRLTAHSDGPGKGAAFTLEIPLVVSG